VITVFHKSSVPASTRVLTFLKQANANAQVTATEDQASTHTPAHPAERTSFNLDIQEGPPTGDQLNSILEYVGAHNAGKIISGARDRADAMAKLKEDAELFKRPLVRYS
jgi:arsenate reductase-like glutaredoxin family protein